MLDGIGPLDPTSIKNSLVGGKVDQVEQLARQGELSRASQEFESYFLSYLFKVMRESVPKGALTANPMGEMFYSFYDEEIGKRAAQAGGIGLSEFLLDKIVENENSTRHSVSPPPSVKS